MGCLTILTVDFPLFPRRLVKTETKGYSLMDLGASSFIFNSGLVSSHPTSPSRCLNNFSRVLLLFGLGLTRFVTHVYVNYQEHVSEYGIHWNFFFTLGIISWLSKSMFSFPLNHYYKLGVT